MEKVGAFVVWLLLAALAVFLIGLAIYLIWPQVIPFVFPELVASGYIAREIGFWTAIGLSFLCNILFKSSSPKK